MRWRRAHSLRHDKGGNKWGFISSFAGFKSFAKPFIFQNLGAAPFVFSFLRHRHPRIGNQSLDPTNKSADNGVVAARLVGDMTIIEQNKNILPICQDFNITASL